MNRPLTFPRLDFTFSGHGTEAIIVSELGRVSISGAQEKFAATLDNGRLRLTKDGERGEYILKPAPLNYAVSCRSEMPANEALTMQLAGLYGIETAKCGIVTDSKGRPVYVTRRFDIGPDGTRLKMEDFASILGRSESSAGSGFKYTGSYEDIAAAIRSYIPAWSIAMEKFFRIVVFNYIFANGDAHLKNFSIMLRDGEYGLAPAYDLVNTRIHTDDSDFALSEGLSPRLEKSDTYLMSGHPCRLDFERFAALVGIAPIRAARILDEFTSVPERVEALIAASQLTEKQQRRYKAIIHERTQRFIRQSEQ